MIGNDARGSVDMWWTKAINPQMVESMYDEAPRLDKLRLAGIGLSNDGPRLGITFAGIAFPDHPPTRWRSFKYDDVMLAVDFFAITDFSMTGWHLNNEVIVEMRSDSANLIAVIIHGEALKLSFQCGMFRFQQFVPCHKNSTE